MSNGTNSSFPNIMPQKLISYCIFWFSIFTMSTAFVAGASYSSNLRNDVTRPYIGKEFWPNPQMDWQLNEGRMEVMISNVGKTHEIHLLTHQLKPEQGSFSQSVQLSFKDINPKKLNGLVLSLG